MRNYTLIFIKYLLFLPFLLLAQPLFAQNWPLQKIGGLGFQWSAGNHSFLSKVKYGNNGNIYAMFNYVFYNSAVHIDVDGLSTLDYKLGGIQSINIMDQNFHFVYGGGSYSDYARDFEIDNAGNFTVAGDNLGNNWNPVTPVSANPNDSSQVMLFQKAPDNSYVWYKLYGGSSAEYTKAIKKTADGNYLVLAQTQSNDGDVVGYNGGKDIWLLKINASNGNIMWQKTIGGPADESPTDLEILSNGSILISGSADPSGFLPSSYAGTNAFLIKLDGTGNIIWKKTFGGDGEDMIKSFAPVDDGGFVSIGTSNSTNGDITSNLGGTDVFIFKHDATGNIVWKKFYGNSDNDEACDIVYRPCDSMIFAAYAKEFNHNTYNPGFPRFCQKTGVQIGIYNNATQFFYKENDFTYPPLTNYDIPFGGVVVCTMESDNKGGIFTGYNQDYMWGAQPSPWTNNKTRSFMAYEYGFVLNRKNYDTSICYGQTAWGNNYYTDTTFADTLRNACLADTLISKYNVHVINADTTKYKDTLICYGKNYQGAPVYASFDVNDTTSAMTICGPRKLITRTHINVPPEIKVDLGNDQSLCSGGSILLDASRPLSTYLWQNNSTAPTHSAVASGLYWVEVTDTAGCKKRDSINIAIDNLYLAINSNISIFPGESVQLIPQTNGTVTWQADPTLSCTSCQSPMAKPQSTTTFYLASDKNSCTLKDSVTVIVKKGFYLYIPTAFTPNDDIHNPIFKIYTNISSDLKFQVFNRWGEKIFETKDPNIGWDGSYKGARQPQGTYVYVVTYTDKNFTVPQMDKGYFVLFR